jgi:excisionase family DNA binding protein
MVTTIQRLTGYLRPSKAAARIGVSEATLRNWAQRGELPVMVTPNGRLYREWDVEQAAQRWAEKGRRG